MMTLSHVTQLMCHKCKVFYLLMKVFQEKNKDFSFSTFGDRYEYAKKEIGFTNKQVADLVNLSPQAVGQWKKKNKLSDTVKKKVSILCHHYGISVDWMENGRGSMMKGQSDMVAEPGQEYVYAGGKGNYSTAKVIEESWNYVKQEVQKGNKVKIFRVVGDSMTPTLYDTDIVFAIEEPDFSNIRQSYIYVVHSKLHGDLMIKRVVNRFDGTLLLTSDNRKHGQTMIKLKDVNKLWRVKSYLSWQMGAPDRESTVISTLMSEVEELKRLIGK